MTLITDAFKAPVKRRSNGQYVVVNGSVQLTK